MTNNSGIKPVGISVLVLPDSVEKTSASGIVLATDQQLEREQLRQTDGIVIELAENAYYDEKLPRCKVGDRVIMAAYAGMVREGIDEKAYRLIRDSDVIAILIKGKENE